MDPLTYCALNLGYILGLKPLSDTDKQKVCLIEDINKIQKLYKKGELTPEQFDTFWECSAQQLQAIVESHSSLLLRA